MPTVALKRALATYRAHTAVYRHVRLLFLVRLESYLNAAGLSGALHSGGDVNGVAPNIIVWFSGSDDSGSYRAVINPCIQEQQPYLLHHHRFINACPLASSNIDHCFYDKWNGWIEMIPVIDLQVELASPNHSIKLIVKKREETKKKKEKKVKFIWSSDSLIDSRERKMGKVDLKLINNQFHSAFDLFGRWLDSINLFSRLYPDGW